MATVLGIFGAFLVIGTAMVLGGSPESFVDLPAILIVIFGTLLVTIVSFSLEEVWRGLSVIRRAAIYHSLAPSVAATQILYLADMARRRGKLSLQGDVKKFRQNSFLFNAINMVVDGLPAEQVEKILIAEVDATRHRHLSTAGVLRRAGEVAPAMGLIGTLVGLVQMLGNLDDPSSIGPSMAVALLTTFYGAVLANMVFNPLAGKLERNADAEAAVNHIYTLGASSICRQDNPRRLEIMLNSGLPPGERVAYFNS
ncbi:MAG: MotA/TolQ/ExbB proton channel family protein [Kiloniellales bacterium]|nr:MotA/TolQ/ExbB proton channel family protein [Kiloniellales bacterium]